MFLLHTDISTPPPPPTSPPFWCLCLGSRFGSLIEVHLVHGRKVGYAKFAEKQVRLWTSRMLTKKKSSWDQFKMSIFFHWIRPFRHIWKFKICLYNLKTKYDFFFLYLHEKKKILISAPFYSPESRQMTPWRRFTVRWWMVWRWRWCSLIPPERSPTNVLVHTRTLSRKWLGKYRGLCCREFSALFLSLQWCFWIVSLFCQFINMLLSSRDGYHSWFS